MSHVYFEVTVPGLEQYGRYTPETTQPLMQVVRKLLLARSGNWQWGWRKMATFMAEITNGGSSFVWKREIISISQAYRTVCVAQASWAKFGVLADDMNLYKGKAVPLQTWSGPESYRKLRVPDYMTTAQDGGKVVSLTHRPPLPPGNTPGTHFC
jgi:hypothetical protein